MSDGHTESAEYHAGYTVMSEQSEQYSTREQRRSAGRTLRLKIKRVDQGKFDPRARKVDPVELLTSANRERREELIPLKNARMATTPFTFYRGSAPLMAADLAQLPRTGIQVQICGDAHVQNLGAFGGVRRPPDFRHQRL